MDLRMNADFAAAQRELRETKSDIENIGKATAAANAEIASIRSGAATAAPDTGASVTVPEVAANDALNASLAQGVQARQAVAAASRATQQAVASEIGLIGDLQARLER